jgi:hypothetical protein
VVVGEDRLGGGIADYHQKRVIGPVIGLVELDQRGPVDGWQRLRGHADPRVRMLAEQRLPERLVRHVLRRGELRLELLGGIRGDEIELGLRKRRVPHDVGQQRQHPRQRFRQPAHLERGRILARRPGERGAEGEHLRLELFARSRRGSFLRRLRHDLREAGLGRRIDREARLHSENRRKLGHAAVAHRDDPQAIRQRAFHPRRRREGPFRSHLGFRQRLGAGRRCGEDDGGRHRQRPVHGSHCTPP